MNNTVTNNSAVFNYLKQTFPFTFKDINYSSNCITFKGESILLDNFDLQDFLNHNSFVIRDFSNKEAFNIIKVHVDTINKVIPPSKAAYETTLLRPITIDGKEQRDEDEKELISMDRFLVLASKEEDYNQDDKNELLRFFDLFKNLLICEQYLTDEVYNILNSIKEVISILDGDMT